MLRKDNFYFEKIEKAKWFLKKDYSGQDVYIFATEEILKNMDLEVFLQAKNVSQMPGLAGPVYIMPDAHSGYGAPIGTVFAMDKKDGFVSPGAVGYDINCGMRLIKTNLFEKEIISVIKELVDLLFEYVPPGVGKRGFLKINKNELKKIAEKGAVYLIKEKGLGWDEDIEKIEENGQIKNADFSSVSKEAIERGIHQIATLGSGNHYLEIQKVEKIFNKKKAKEFGFYQEGQIAIMIHCGSRGFGHQICSDYLRLFEKKLDLYKIKVPDRQLACLPISSSLGQRYIEAMNSAANFAFANRQAITYQVRKAFEKIFDRKSEDLGMSLVYDVAHNIAKFEKYNNKELLIHRKGATRSFPNQPVIIGGSMETGSYLLVGTEKAIYKSFGSTAHGSGRTMSRAKAKKIVKGEKLWRELEQRGIYIKSASFSGLAEEAGLAYKNISQVVESVRDAEISYPIVYFKPIGNIKG